MYTIGQVSEMVGLPASTLRYYDKQGLFPHLERQSGIRQFSDREVESLRVIECLKTSGLEIAEIRHYFELSTEGAKTYAERKALFEARKQAVEQEMVRLQKTLDMLNYKCWFYDTVIASGNEEEIRALLPDKLPPDIQKLYDNAHR